MYLWIKDIVALNEFRTFTQQTQSRFKVNKNTLTRKGPWSAFFFTLLSVCIAMNGECQRFETNKNYEAFSIHNFPNVQIECGVFFLEIVPHFLRSWNIFASQFYSIQFLVRAFSILSHSNRTRSLDIHLLCIIRCDSYFRILFLFSSLFLRSFH